MGAWFDPRTGQVVPVPDPPARPAPPREPVVALPAPERSQSRHRLSDGSPAYVVRDGTTHWNPALFADHSLRIAHHEAAHAVANYLLDLPMIRASVSEREGYVSIVETGDHHAHAVASLAGKAFERSIGLAPSRDRHDLDNAERHLQRAGCQGARLEEAARVAEEAALELTRSERFHTLTFALAKVLVKERTLGWSRILQILEDADPKRVRTGHATRGVPESHAVHAPSVPWVDHPRGPQHNPDCVVCLAYPSGPPR